MLDHDSKLLLNPRPTRSRTGRNWVTAAESAGATHGGGTITMKVHAQIWPHDRDAGGGARLDGRLRRQRQQQRRRQRQQRQHAASSTRTATPGPQVTTTPTPVATATGVHSNGVSRRLRRQPRVRRRTSRSTSPATEGIQGFQVNVTYPTAKGSFAGSGSERRLHAHWRRRRDLHQERQGRRQPRPERRGGGEPDLPDQYRVHLRCDGDDHQRAISR